MPITPRRRRELERQRRRRHLRHQRQAAALALVLVTLALTGIGLFLLGLGGSSEANAGESSKAQATGTTATRPKSLERLVKAAVGTITRRSRAQQRAALRRFAVKGEPLYCGGSKGNYVALTFDDGPSAYTEMALGILGDEQVPATFFLVGRNIHSRWAALRHELLGGSEIGIHTWSHVSLVGLDPAEIRREIASTGNEITDATGRKVQMMRPPYGDHDATVDGVLRRMRMVEVLWSIDSGDSQGNNWKQIGHEVLDNIRPGSIVLMHENRGQTIRALHRLILPGLKKKGLIPVTVPQLLVLDPPPAGVPTSRCD
jgi:peptidoglycan/xylan/chitin deacetylase (PgdA/CDA1 family)